MARVIKAGAGGQKPTRPATRMIVDAGDKKIIERAVFQAKQDAEHILMRAENERQAIIADGKKQAARAREEAMARGASEAFAAAAAEALAAFRKRADRYGEAADDIRALALEVVKKVLGNDPDLGPKDVDKIMQRGMSQLRARRRLRLQVSARRLSELAGERPNLMKALQSEPDLVIEAVDDVSEGFARVVTEIGGALCAEETALDALSATVNVREQPRQQRGGGTGVSTNVGTAPSGTAALRRAGGPSAAQSVADDDVEELEADEDGDDTMNLAPAGALARRAATRAVQNEQRTHGEQRTQGEPRTQNTQRTQRSVRGDEVEEIQVEEDEMPDEPTARRTAARVQNGQIQGGAPVPGNRAPATRVVPIDAKRGDSDETTRHAPLVDDDDDGDEDLDLFTDDAVKSPRKRR